MAARVTPSSAATWSRLVPRYPSSRKRRRATSRMRFRLTLRRRRGTVPACVAARGGGSGREERGGAMCSQLGRLSYRREGWRGHAYARADAALAGSPTIRRRDPDAPAVTSDRARAELDLGAAV